MAALTVSGVCWHGAGVAALTVSGVCWHGAGVAALTVSGVCFGCRMFSSKVPWLPSWLCPVSLFLFSPSVSAALLAFFYPPCKILALTRIHIIICNCLRRGMRIK